MQTVAKRILDGALIVVATALLAVGLYQLLTAGLAFYPRVTVATLGAFGLAAGAYATGSAAQQLRDSPTSSTDIVQDAIDKVNFGERAAAGTVDGEDVLLVADVNTSGFPTLTVHAEELDGDEHRAKTTISFETVADLQREFDDLVDEYDLSTTDAEEAGA